MKLVTPLAWALAESEEQEPPVFNRGGIEATYTYPMPKPGLTPEEKVEIYGAGYPKRARSLKRSKTAGPPQPKEPVSKAGT